jgi:hypothetical protein
LIFSRSFKAKPILKFLFRDMKWIWSWFDGNIDGTRNCTSFLELRGFPGIN